MYALQTFVYLTRVRLGTCRSHIPILRRHHLYQLPVSHRGDRWQVVRVPQDQSDALGQHSRYRTAGQYRNRNSGTCIPGYGVSECRTVLFR